MYKEKPASYLVLKLSENGIQYLMMFISLMDRSHG